MAEVYCYGHVSTGRVLRLRDHYPEADGYAEVVEILENHAGEATGTALVLTRLGVSVALEGNWIGDIPECRRTLEFLQQRGVDCSGLRVVPNYPGVTEVVVSDGASRTVFGRYIDLLFTTKQWDDPDPRKIAAARIVSVDSTFGEATLAAARHAAAASEDERAGLFARYPESCPGLVAFTAGAHPVWWGRGRAKTDLRRRGSSGGNAEPGRRHQLESFPVKVVDTAGAGDSFRGGLVYGLLQDWPDAECVRFATAVAALVCTRAPGCVHPPALDEVRELLSVKRKFRATRSRR